MVDPAPFRELVARIPDATYARYPHLSGAAVEEAVDDFLCSLDPSPPGSP